MSIHGLTLLSSRPSKFIHVNNYVIDMNKGTASMLGNILNFSNLQLYMHDYGNYMLVGLECIHVLLCTCRKSIKFCAMHVPVHKSTDRKPAAPILSNGNKHFDCNLSDQY